MKILIVKSIFIPSTDYLKTNIDSIQSIISYIYKNKYETTVVLSGWIKNNDDIIKIKKLFINNNIILDIWSENKGKIYLLNNICKYNIEHNILLYLDHDIYIKDDIFNDIDSLLNDKIMISFTQYPDNRHNELVYLNEITINDKTYNYSTNNLHMASGCFIVKTDIIDLFKTLYSSYVYGEEDIVIANLLTKYNYTHLLSQNQVIHPLEQNKEYDKWKEHMIFKIIGNTKVEVKNSYF